jgi:cytochrome c biogenesis protein CcmG/thiol:disulfide interchange protein DsbE
MHEPWMVSISKRLWLILPMAFALLLGMFLYQALQEGSDSRISSLLGNELPEFVAESLQEPVKMVTQDDILGQTTVLNVWATWCPTCKAEHTFLNTMAANGVRIVGINYHDQRAQAQQWLRNYGDPYAFSIYDPQGQLGIELGVTGAPESYLVDASGIIIDKLVGELNERTWARLKPQYQALLSGEP